MPWLRQVHLAVMDQFAKPNVARPTIEVETGADGSVLYRIDFMPDAMPCVRVRDLAQAWDDARHAARACAWSVKRGLQFHRGDGSFLQLALADPDAACWAGAVDRMAGLNTAYGLSLCLRLLALVDLLAHAPWAAGLLLLQPDGARLHPGLLRLAANATLMMDMRFDVSRFQSDLSHLIPNQQAAGSAVTLTGVCV